MSKKETSSLLADYYKEQAEKELESFSDILSTGDEITEPHIFSEGYKENMSNLIAEHKKKQKYIQRKRKSRQIAAVLAIGIVLSAIGAFQTEAIRNTVLNFFIEIKEESTEIIIKKQEGDSRFQEYLPEYIPKGYKESERNNGVKSLMIVYRNDEDKIYYVDISEHMSQTSIDTENAKFTETEINGYKTFISEKQNITIVMMVTSNLKITTAGNLDREESLKVLTSIKKLF